MGPNRGHNMAPFRGNYPIPPRFEVLRSGGIQDPRGPDPEGLQIRGVQILRVSRSGGSQDLRGPDPEGPKI